MGGNMTDSLITETENVLDRSSGISTHRLELDQAGNRLSIPLDLTKPEPGAGGRTPPNSKQKETYYEIKSGWMLGLINRRNTKKKNFLCAPTGDPGSQKTTWALYWAEQHDEDFDCANAVLIFNPPML